MTDKIERASEADIFEQNNFARHDFGGYSPAEMCAIVYEPFQEKSPIQLKSLHADDYTAIPIFNIAKYIIEYIHTNKYVLLTENGEFEPAFEKQILEQRFYPFCLLEDAENTEDEFHEYQIITIARILLILAKITKKRGGKLTLTPQGELLMNDNERLLRSLLYKFGYDYNWGYTDDFPNGEIGKFGYGFSIYMLHRYGDTKRDDSFYMTKYFNAFPDLLSGAHTKMPYPRTDEIESCYSKRTFNRFMSLFGLIEMEPDTGFDINNIEKSELLDKMFYFIPHTIFRD